mgnify:CR=1 FL=1
MSDDEKLILQPNHGKYINPNHKREENRDSDSMAGISNLLIDDDISSILIN